MQASTALGLIRFVKAPKCEDHRPTGLPKHRADNDRAPVDNVCDRTSRQSEQKERCGRRRRHQREPEG